MAGRKQAAEPTAKKGRHTKKRRSADYGALNRLVGYRLRLTQIAFYERIFRGLAAEGGTAAEFTPARYAALVIIDANRGLSQSDLGRALGIARSGAMMMIDWFEQRGLIRRKPHPDDKRSHALVTTPAGLRMLARLHRIFETADRASAEALSMSEKESLSAALVKILQRG